MELDYKGILVTLSCKFYGRDNLRIRRLSLRYSKPTSLHNFSLDVPLTATVIARAVLHWIDSIISVKFPLGG